MKHVLRHSPQPSHTPPQPIPSPPPHHHPTSSNLTLPPQGLQPHDPPTRRRTQTLRGVTGGGGGRAAGTQEGTLPVAPTVVATVVGPAMTERWGARWRRRRRRSRWAGAQWSPGPAHAGLRRGAGRGLVRAAQRGGSGSAGRDYGSLAWGRVGEQGSGRGGGGGLWLGPARSTCSQWDQTGECAARTSPLE